MAQKPSEPQAGGFPAEIGNPATQALIHAGYTQLEELTKMSEKELLQLHGVGPKAARILKAALEEKGLSFAEPLQKRK